MTKKHFEAIAEIIRSDKGMYSNAEDMRDLIARELASFCAQENPWFNRSRFLRACDVSD